MGTATREALAEAAESVLTRGPHGCIVVFTDEQGTPQLPDFAAASGGPRLNGAETNDLSFTYNSPAEPWTAAEMTNLTNVVTDLYPLIRRVYGPPAFNIVVNVRKNSSLGSAGAYSLASNELILKTAYNSDVVCHEIIHAFHDDNIITLSCYEEGMTRAAEVEVFHVSTNHVHGWDQNHSYVYDVYYEGLNQPAIGAKDGRLFSGYVSSLVRYQLAGYAWAKPLLENTNFLSAFNATFYTRQLADATTRQTESKLLDILTNVQGIVEGRTFMDWYNRQCVLDTDPAEGYQIYHRINQYTVDYFERNATGTEIMQGNADIAWSVYNHAGELLDSGTNTTSANGWVTLSPSLGGYTGRITVEATATCPTGTVVGTAQRSSSGGSGVFGVGAHLDRGTVTVFPVDDPALPATAVITNGQFNLAALANARGRFIVAVTDAAGRVGLAHFTKDASDYFLSLEEDDLVPLSMASLVIEGNDVRVSWNGLGQCGFVVQTAVSNALMNGFADIGSRVLMPGTGAAQTNYLHTGVLTTNGAGFYRVRVSP